MGGHAQPGIYVEILIRVPMDRVWALTQTPEQHQRWDLRFTSIDYLPRLCDSEPQRFLYETHLTAGLKIQGTGESVATRVTEDGSGVSSLKFASEDRLSLIREGAGYWRYVQTAEGVRFLTWYDYRVRFGAAGHFADYIFRPAIGWATAWSFDRMRLWAERDIVPEVSLRFAVLHALCRLAIGGVWLWQGLVPKLLFRDGDERAMLTQAGVAAGWLPWIGVAELGMAMLVLLTWRWRGMFVLQAVLMLATLAAVSLQSASYLTRAFNPVTLNLMVMALAAIGWLAGVDRPSAGCCLRRDPRRAGAQRSGL